MMRHRTLAEIAADCIARTETARDGVPARAVCATDFRQVVEAIRHLDTFPTVLVVPTGGDYDGRGAWRRRDDRVNILSVGEWSADVAGSDTDVWALAEAVVRCFFPGGDLDDADPADTHSSRKVELNGVLYTPLSLQPVAVGADRTAINVLLGAENPMQTFDS